MIAPFAGLKNMEPLVPAAMLRCGLSGFLTDADGVSVHLPAGGNSTGWKNQKRMEAACRHGMFDEKKQAVSIRPSAIETTQLQVDGV
jgi:hypothetical protein